MKLKTLTPKHLKTFDDKYNLFEDVPPGQWHNFERAFISAVWSAWFVEAPDCPGKNAPKEEIVNYIENDMDMNDYSDLAHEVVLIYTTGKQKRDLPAKDPN